MARRRYLRSGPCFVTFHPKLSRRILPSRIPYATSLALSGTLLLCVTLIPKSLAHFVVAAAIVGKFFITVSFAIVYMFSTELFPTVLRTTGAGCSTVQDFTPEMQVLSICRYMLF